MPRAFDRGIPDVDKNPLRNATDYSDPEGFIGQGATEAANVLGNVFRQFLALDQIEAAFTEFAESFIEIDWLSPQAVRDAIAAAGKLLAEIGRWILQLLKNFTRLDLTANGDFVRDLIELLAFADLQAAWETFSTGWNALNWSNPLTALHPGWMLVVDFFWDVAAWLGHVVRNIFGIAWPGFLGLTQLRAAWTAFFTKWSAISWASPLSAIHQAWMAVVDLAADLWAWFKSVLTNITGIEIPSFLNGEEWKALWQRFADAWDGINLLSLGGLWQALSAVVTLLRDIAHWAIGVLRNFTGIDLEAIAASFNLDALAAAFTTWSDTLLGINWANPLAGLMTAIGAFFQLFRDVGNWLLGLLEDWLGWSVDAVGEMFSSVQNFIFRITEYVWGEAGLGGLVNVIEKLAGFAGATIVQAITGAYTEISRLLTLIGSFLNLGGLVDFIASILGEDGLLGLLVRIPFIGPLVSAITGITPEEGTALDLTTLVTWARGLLTGNSPIPGGNIVGQISEAILSVIPVANISALSPNLLSQGNFNNNLTVSEGGGWSWDGTTTATGTGGAAKLVATGSPQELFSRQAVKVNAGDRVDLSCKVRTSGFTAGAGRSMVLSVIPWTMFGGAMVQQPTITVATRTTSATSWADMTGTTWTVPANVVRLTVRLAVTANSGAVVWFDDAKVSKTGELGQNLVESLITAWNQLIGGLTNPVAGAAATTGKTWQDLFGGASAFRGKFNTEEDRGNLLRLNLFGSPTTVNAEVQLTAVPPIPRSKSPDMQSIINGLWRGLFGQRQEDSTAEDVLTAAAATQDAIAKAKTAIADLQSKSASGAFSGQAVAVDFSGYTAASLLPNPPWQNTTGVSTPVIPSPSGSGALGVANGAAAWVTGTLDNRRTVHIHTTPTDRLYQMVTLVLTAAPNSSGAANLIVGRSNTTGSTSIIARLTTFAIQLYAVSGGSETLIKSVSGFVYGATYRLECGVGNNPNRFRVWQENRVVIDEPYAAAPSGLYTGLGAEARTYSQGGQTRQSLPAPIGVFTLADNSPAAVLGSGFRIGSNAGSTSVSATAGGVWNIPDGFFGSSWDQKTDDLTWNSTTNELTVTVAGWYLVTVALKRGNFTDTQQHFSAAVLRNGAVHSVGQQQWGFIAAGGDAGGQRSSAVVSVPMYLSANDVVRPGYVARNTTAIVGSSDRAESYFSVAFMSNVKPVNAAA